MGVDGTQKRLMLEELLLASVALTCLDVLCARWGLDQPAQTVSAAVGVLLTLISYVVRDQSVVNKNNGKTQTEPMVKDG
jgi:hypothetical protein